MPTLYKLLTALLALTGCAGLLLTGEVSLMMSSGAAALMPGYYRFFRGRQPAPVYVIGLLSIIELIIFLVDATVITGDVFIAVAHLTIAFQALKSFDLKEPWDNLQVYFVSLLQLIIASELTSSLVFGGVFVFFLVVLVAAMVLSHFLKEGHLEAGLLKRPVFLISCLTLLMTCLFFVLLPRTPYRFLGKSHLKGVHTSGFSEQVDFASMGSITLDPAVVMRVEMGKDVPGPLYWRGHTLDHFDGITWKNELPRTRIRKQAGEFLIAPYQTEQAVEQQITLEPMDSEIIFGLSEIRGIKADSFFLLADSAGDLSMPGKISRRVRYTVNSLIADRSPGEARDRYLQLPAGNQNITELARSVVRSVRGNGLKAQALEEHLRREYLYSLTIEAPAGGVSPVEDFLFRTKKGYCEHYATAMVLMLRSLGIHARVVTGFLGGDRNNYGDYIIVRRSNAHSWVEALIDGTWRRYDPTPPVVLERSGNVLLFWDSVAMYWARHVVGFSPADQKALFGGISTGFSRLMPHVPEAKPSSLRDGLYYAALLMIVLTLFLVALVLIRRRAGGGSALTASYVRVRRALSARGLTVTPSTTSGELSSLTKAFPFHDGLADFLEHYNARRFGRAADGRSFPGGVAPVLKQIRKKRFRGRP
ncbi:MAG: transglutaminase family protein [Thermodesulfovibrionales bacterium]